MSTLHPAVQNAVDALEDLGKHRPADATELADMLAGIHAFGTDSVISALLGVLHGLADAAFDIPGALAHDRRDASDTLDAAALYLSRLDERYLTHARGRLTAGTDGELAAAR